MKYLVRGLYFSVYMVKIRLRYYISKNGIYVNKTNIKFSLTVGDFY